jgi:MFS family permease
VLFVWSAYGFVQSYLWNFYGPIAIPLQHIYGWSDGFIGWLPNSANFSFCLSLPLFSVLLERWGLRRSALTGGTLLVISAATNALFFALPPPSTRAELDAARGGGQYGWLAVTAELLNGASAPIQNITPALVGFHARSGRKSAQSPP